MKYLPNTITLTIDITGYAAGDYCRLYSNAGSGSINWTTSHDNRKISIYDAVETELDIPVVVDIAGTWIFGFKTYDSKGNVSGSTPGTESEAIDLTPDVPPTMTLNDYDPDTDVLILNTNLTTSTPIAGEHYNVYRDDGAGGAINYSSAVGTYDDEDETVTITSQNLNASAGTLKSWRYVAKGENDSTDEGAPSDYCTVVVDENGVAQYQVGNVIQSQSATAIAAGKIRITWLYNPIGQPETPTGFKVYQSSGGAYSLVRTEPYVNGKSKYLWTTGALTNGTTYSYYVRTYRTVSETDYETQNTTAVTATADTSSPTVISTFIITV